MRPAVVALACLHCLLPSVSAGVIPSTANPVAEPEPADAPGGEIPTFAGLSGNDCRPRGYLRRTTISPGVVRSTRTGADRKSVVSGKSVSVRVDLGGRRSVKKTTTKQE